MSEDRAKAANRVARVRAEMARLADWRRIKTEQDCAALEAARADLDRYAAEAQPQGVLARTVLAQAGRLAQRQERAAERRDRSRTAAEAAQRQLKTAETLADHLTRAARDARERKELERLIEQLAAANDPASLP
jgi:endonuclease/exonuclease/phosphatase (EEP) superfamily protein YafD